MGTDGQKENISDDKPTLLRRKPNQDVVATLRTVLEMAERGDVESVLVLTSGWAADGDPASGQYAGGPMNMPSFLWAWECFKYEKTRVACEEEL